MPDTAAIACKLCGSPATSIGGKTSSFSGRHYELLRCTSCRFAFLANPWTDYAAIYDAAYYAGKGADPMVDYVYELEAPRETIRRYEWSGILSVVRELVPVTDSTAWLDYGCGNGGLMRYCREAIGPGPRLAGFEEGWIAAKAAEHGVRMLTRAELDALPDASFDVITAIEVLEHIEWPLIALREIRRLLKPGGLFFYTTGNAEPFRDNLPAWSYVNPDVHTSYYEPETLRRALVAAGFEPSEARYRAGHTGIIRFKCLKSLGIRKCAVWERCLPWPLLSRVVDARYGVSNHPVGWAR